MLSHNDKLRRLLLIFLCALAFGARFAAPAIGVVPYSVHWKRVDSRWKRGEGYVPDEPPGWKGKISQSDITKIRKAGASINKFAFELYPLMAADAGGNVLFSPYNLAMTLIEEYKEANKKTRRELKKALFLYSGALDDFTLLAGIIQETPEDRGDFRSDSAKTYFKSDWEFPFYNYEEWYKLGAAYKFRKPSGKTEPLKVMEQSQRLKYYEDDRVKSFEFPFVDRYYSYIIILPKDGWDERRIRETLTYKKYLSLLSKQKDKNLFVSIVDTKITSRYDFSGWLNSLGIKGVKEDKLKQENIIDIYGGEQSRAVMTRWSTRFFYGPMSREELKKLYPFNVDYNFSPTSPFVYFIVDNRSGAILLILKVV